MNTELEIDLSGNHWKMEKIRPGAGVQEGFHLLPSEYQGTYFNWNQAAVPGDVYTDLQRAGELDDLLMGRNMHRAKWAQEYEYWYVCKFNTTEDMSGKDIELIFEGVDFSCEAWLNGQYLGKHEGMFSAFSFDITQKIRFEQWFEGCNILMIKLDPPPRNYRRVAGRKFCFSGDYMPGLVPFGIWRPIKVRAVDKCKIDAVRIESSINKNDATVDVEIEIENLGNAPVDLSVNSILEGENFESTAIRSIETYCVNPGRNKLTFSIGVADAKLWWPWDMGDPNLYQLYLELKSGDTLCDSKHEIFGIREVRMERNPGFTEDEVENPWTFIINGKRHFLRSICWGGPPSYFYGRNTKKKYEDRLNWVREANVNNLRIFGWHPPEIPHFYELCDRLGITVWTNFSFATQAFEASPEFLPPALAECAEIVKQRRNHPSNIFWMGGEEVYFSDAHVDSDNKEIMEELGKTVIQVTNIPYGLASPMSGDYGLKLGFKPKESVHANEHYYSAHEHTFMEEYYPSLDYCVIPELTAASAPDVESLKKFIPENELWPMGPSWGYHWADISILKMLNVEVFGDTRTGSLEEFVEATQIAHGIIAQFALEHFRRRKPRVSAVALCHFMTYLPDIKWGIIDYFGKKKRSFEYVTRAYQPILVSLEYTKRRWISGEAFQGKIWIVNDHQKAYQHVKLSWSVFDPQKNKLHDGMSHIDIEADSSVEIQDLQCVVSGEEFEFFTIELKLEDSEGKTISENTHTLSIGDQVKEKQRCLYIHSELMAEKIDLGPGYYRYHEELWNLD